MNQASNAHAVVDLFVIVMFAVSQAGGFLWAAKVIAVS